MKYTGFAYMFFISANLSDYIFMNKHKIGVKLQKIYQIKRTLLYYVNMI